MAEENMELFAPGSQTVTQTTAALKEESVTVVLHMPVKKLKLVLKYLNPYEYGQWLKSQTSSIKKTLKSGKNISEAQVEMLNHEMAISLENLISNFKEQVCQPLQIDPGIDSKEIKLFKLRANKHVIAVLEEINNWMTATLEKVSGPNQCIDEKVKEYDQIIKDLKKKIKLLQTDKLSLDILSPEESKADDLAQNIDGDLEDDQGGEKKKKKIVDDKGDDNKADKDPLSGSFPMM